jgi:hypothetical protein
MKNKIYFLFILLFALNIGCNDNFLDRVPYNGLSSSMIFDSDKNAVMAINGVYTTLAKNSFDSNFFMFISTLGPEGVSVGRTNVGMSWAQGIGTTREASVTSVYKNMYRAIMYANEVILGLDGNTKVTESLRTRLIGEAKFLRGLCYFYLYNLYGGVVIIDKPILTNEEYKERNTRDEVVNLVIADFTDAVSKLPETYSAAELGRATKGAAIAMLGKTYLYEKKWTEAAGQFEKLLVAPYKYELVANYGDNFYWKTQNNKESVFEIQYEMLDGYGSSFDNYYGNRSMNNAGQDYCETSQRVFRVFTNNNGSSFDFSTIPQQTNYTTEKAYGVDLIKWYQNTFANADKRLLQSSILPGSTFFAKGDMYYQVYWPYTSYVGATPPPLKTTFTTEAVIPIRKFLTLGGENSVARTTCPTNFPVIRFADVLLMYAEAKNEISGPVTEVYSAINKIKTRAGIVTATQSLTKDQMRREIWLERFKEFMFEDILFFDVRRWNVAHTNDPVFGLNNDEWDFRLQKKWYTKVFNDTRDYLWPIPGGEIDINNKMMQNPGW